MLIAFAVHAWRQWPEGGVQRVRTEESDRMRLTDAFWWCTVDGW